MLNLTSSLINIIYHPSKMMQLLVMIITIPTRITLTIFVYSMEAIRGGVEIAILSDKTIHISKFLLKLCVLLHVHTCTVHIPTVGIHSI